MGAQNRNPAPRAAKFPIHPCHYNSPMLLPTRFRQKLTSPAGKFQPLTAYRRPLVRARRQLRRLLKIPPVELLYRTVREMSADDATYMAAGLSYYAILSLFPLTVGLITVFSLILKSDNVEREVFNFFQTYLPGSRNILEANIEAVGNIRGFLGIISLVGLFWTASLLFGAITRAVNRAWDIYQDRPFYIDKLRHLIMTLSVAPLFLMSITATAALQILGSVDLPLVGRLAFLDHNGINILTRPVPFVFSLTIFLLIYKFAPNTRTYWRFIWPGALLAAVLFEISKSAFVFYLENFNNYQRVYGSLTSVIVLLAWTYVSGLILIAGAEFSSEYERMRQGVQRGRVVATYYTRRPPNSPSPPP